MEKTHKVKKGSATEKVDKSTLQPRSRRRSILWNGLNKGTACPAPPATMSPACPGCT